MEELVTEIRRLATQINAQGCQLRNLEEAHRPNIGDPLPDPGDVTPDTRLRITLAWAATPEGLKIVGERTAHELASLRGIVEAIDGGRSETVLGLLADRVQTLFIGHNAGWTAARLHDDKDLYTMYGLTSTELRDYQAARAARGRSQRGRGRGRGKGRSIPVAKKKEASS